MMEASREIQVYEKPMSPADVRNQINLIQEIMRDAMKDNEHFGKIPGCGDKPTLLKPGAEKLNLTFRMAPKYQITRREMPNGHIEYEVLASLFSISSEKFLGQGVGSASTMEGKYRFRQGPVEFTGKPVPKDYWNERDQKMLGGKGFMAKKNPDTGQWEIATVGEKVEHDNPADYYNTILKMAKKRALVDAVLTVTAASDIFTQDIEDMPFIQAEVVDVKPEPSEERKQDKPKQEKKTNPLEEKKTKAAAAMKSIGYSLEKVEDFLGKKYADWGEDELADIRKFYKENKPTTG